MREIYKVYLGYFFSGFGMFSSFLPLFLLSNGLSQMQLSFLISANIFTSAILNIPTGGIADTFGHKISVFIGTLIWSFSFLFFFIGKSFNIYLLGMVIGGLGLSLISGAITSLVYDLLEKMNKKEDFKKVYSRGNGFFLIASMIAVAIGGYVYNYNPRLTFLLAFIFTFISSIPFFFIKTNYKKEKRSFFKYYEQTKIGVLLTLKNKSLLSLILISIGLSFGVTIVNGNIKQPYLIMNHFDVSQIGIISAVISGLLAFFYIYGYKIIKILGDNLSLILIIILSFELLILMSYTTAFVGLFILSLYLIYPAFRDPLMTHLQQEQIQSEQRATMNSTIIFIIQVVIALLLPIGGMIIDKNGLNQSLVYLALITGSISLLGYLFYNNLSKNKKV